MGNVPDIKGISQKRRVSILALYPGWYPLEQSIDKRPDTGAGTERNDEAEKRESEHHRSPQGFRERQVMTT